MPLFAYRAADGGGVVSSGMLEADNTEQAVVRVRELGLMPVVVKPAGVLSAAVSPVIGCKELSYFCRQLAILFESGVSIIHALRIVQSRGVKNRSRLRTALDKLLADVQAGEGLSTAIERCDCFPRFLSGMTAVGEKTGGLPEVYEAMAGYYEKEAKRRGDMLSAFMYPTIVFVAMLFVIIAAVAYVVPSYTGVFMANGVELPAVTVFFMDMSRFFIRYGGYLVGAVVITTVFLYLFLRTERGAYVKGWFLLNVPGVRNVYRRIINRRIAYVLYILLDAGVQVVSALVMADEVISNPALSPLFARIIDETKGGAVLSRLISEQRYFDPLLAGMLATGEETGGLPGAMRSCEIFLEQELDAMTANMNKLIEPVSILVLGIILALIMLAVMLPTFSLGGIL